MWELDLGQKILLVYLAGVMGCWLWLKFYLREDDPAVTIVAGGFWPLLLVVMGALELRWRMRRKHSTVEPWDTFVDW